MDCDCGSNIKHIVLIAGRKQKGRLLAALSARGCCVVNICYGKGSTKAGYLMDTFGLVHEENKVVITCIASGEEADAIFDMLSVDFKFNDPNTGIAYIIPVDTLSY